MCFGEGLLASCCLSLISPAVMTALQTCTAWSEFQQSPSDALDEEIQTKLISVWHYLGER